MLAMSAFKFIGAMGRINGTRAFSSKTSKYDGRQFKGVVADLHDEVHKMVTTTAQTSRIKLFGIEVDFGHRYDMAHYDDALKEVPTSELKRNPLKWLVKKQVRPLILAGVPHVDDTQGSYEDCAIVVVGKEEICRLIFKKIGAGPFFEIYTNFRRDILLGLISQKEERKEFSSKTNITEWFKNREN